MSSEKQQLLDHLKSILQQKVEVLQQAIETTRASRNSDTKSSAGDKHEVGRAMAQIELDNQEATLNKTLNLIQQLEHTPVDPVYDQVVRGSLVSTDLGTYFVSIGMGPVDLEERRYLVISLASPIGQKLRGLKVGDTTQFNSRVLTVRSIE